jgi:hypothetical protein
MILQDNTSLMLLDWSEARNWVDIRRGRYESIAVVLPVPLQFRLYIMSEKTKLKLRLFVSYHPSHCIPFNVLRHLLSPSTQRLLLVRFVRVPVAPDRRL